MAVTGTGAVAAEVKPLYPNPKRKKPSAGVTASKGKPKGSGGKK